MSKMNLMHLFHLITLLLVLTACGGGGSGGSSAASGDNTTPDIQTLLILTGQVVEQDSDKPLANAKVSVEGTADEAFTDEEGYFSLNTNPTTEILLNTTAPNYTSSQKVLDVQTEGSNGVPFSNITLKATRLVDTLLLTSVSSSGKKNAEATEVAMTEVDLDANTEQDIVPGNAGTSLADTMIDFVAIKEIQALLSRTNELLSDSFSDLSYDLVFEFETDESEDLASLLLWRYNIKIGRWELLSGTTLVSTGLEGTSATVVYTVKKTGWYALGKKLQNLACLKGRVIDQNANPVTNAKVIVEGQSFKGQIATATNEKGIFSTRVKAGATIKVHASKGEFKTEAKLLTLQNYTHNQGNAADNSFCQPAGPEAGNPFYLEFPDFSTLVPPTGFTPSSNVDELPLTLVMTQHTLKGTINYVDGDSNKPVPASNHFIKIKNVGAFPLTSDGVLTVSLPIVNKVESVAEMVVELEGKVYAGQVAVMIDPANAETSFALLLKNTSKISIKGAVSLNGATVANANVFLSTGLSALTDSAGSYSFEIPASLVANGTVVAAKYIDVSGGTEHFSAPVALTSDATQTINLELKSLQATIKGLVCDSFGGAISGASIKVLIDGLPSSVQAQSNAEGAYTIKVPLKPNASNLLTIAALHRQGVLNLVTQGFTTLQIDSSVVTDDAAAEYTAEKIILDIKKNDTTVIGKVLVNDVLTQGITVVFNQSKVVTNESGAFKATIAPGKNILALYFGSEPLLISETTSNLYEFIAVAEQETDLGNLKAITSKKITVFTKMGFQKSEDPTSLGIRTILASDTNVAFLHVSAKGSAEAPSISVDSDLASLFSEVKTQEKFLTEQIYKVSIKKTGTLTIRCKASETGGEAVSAAASLIISDENKPPVITRITKESESILSTNATGFSILAEAQDPENSPLTFNWKIDSPNINGVTLKNETSEKVSLFTKDTDASEIVLVLTVSDGAKSVSKKAVIAVTKRSNAVTQFLISPEGVVSKGKQVTVNLTTDDSVGLQSIVIDWGDLSEKQSLKKGKSFAPTHTYDKEGDFTIVVDVVDEKGGKTTLNKSVKVSDSYVAPILMQGTLTTDEDVAAKMDLSSLISNFDANKRYTFSVVKKPSRGDGVVSGLTLSYSPNLNLNGFDQILLKVSDGTAFSNETDVKISIKPVNDAPVLSSSNTDATVGSTIQIDLKKLVTDPDETDQHSFKIVTAPALGTATIEGNILSYLGNSVGSDKLVVVASDQIVNSNNATQFIKINQIAGDLKLANVNSETDQNKELVVDLSKHLTNSSNLPSVAYSITQNGALGSAIVSEDKLIYKPNKNVTGTDSLFVIAKSGSVSSQPALFTIVIKPVAVAPVLVDHTTSLKVGDELIVDLTKMISNYDAKNTYTFQVPENGKPLKGDYNLEGLSLHYKAFAASTGIDKMALIATANGLQSNVGAVSITLEQVILPPEISSSPVKTTNEGSLYTYKVIANHPNNLPLTFSLEKAPSWLKINQNFLSGTPVHKDVGLHNILIKVSDGTNTVEQSFDLEVKDVNFAPVITSSPPTIASVGLLFSYLPKATDVDGDSLSWALTTDLSKMTLNKTTGEISWTPTAGDPKESTVTLRVSDGVNTASQKWVVFLSIAAPKIIACVASDPDNLDVTFSNGDVITIDFDQSTNTPPVRSVAEIGALLKFNQEIGLTYKGKWTTKSRLEIAITDAGSAKPKIGFLRATVLAEGQLKNEAGTSDASTASSDGITGNWGTGQ